jgi:GPH family glycoside/pentoside/hexuronide:cation symporter
MMLGDADYSEWKIAEELLGLIYSAGSTATKFGGGITQSIG